jgi:hypothetical protein
MTVPGTIGGMGTSATLDSLNSMVVAHTASTNTGWNRKPCRKGRRLPCR